MKLHELEKEVKRSKKRVGRGHGSGKGKTSARGSKGQKSRENISVSFEGGQLRLVKRLPFLRGVGNVRGAEAIAVNLDDLSAFKTGSRINVEALLREGIISGVDAKSRKIKILGDGEITVALKVELPVSTSAAKKIKAAGGQILEEADSVEPKESKGEDF